MVKRTKIPIYIKHFLIEQKESNNLLTNNDLVTLVKTNYNLNIEFLKEKCQNTGT